jgi:hypothetical protein
VKASAQALFIAQRGSLLRCAERLVHDSSRAEDIVQAVCPRSLRPRARMSLIGSGFASNFGKRKNAAYVFLTAILDADTWGAELAAGEGRVRI